MPTHPPPRDLSAEKRNLTDVLLRSAVFAYSRSKGLFAGISLDGSVVSIDDDANRKVYETDVTDEQILLGKASEQTPQWTHL